MAAGFAPIFRESNLDDLALAPVRQAIDAIMMQQEPFPAVVMNRRWDIIVTSGAARRFFGWLLGGSGEAQSFPCDSPKISGGSASFQP